MSENKKYFLDLGGLKTLWNKMKASFASKSDLESILNMVLAISPKEVNTYSAALESAKSVAPGIAIKVKNAETINDETKPAGIYLVENIEPVTLVYVGNSNSNISTEELAQIISKIAALEAEAIKKVVISDGTNSEDLTITENTLAIIYDNNVDINSESIHALTHKAVAAKFKEMESMISTLPTFKISVVDTLPISNISLSTIYLVKATDTDTNNLFTEYIYVQNGTEYNWEKLGEHKLATGEGVSIEQVNTVISNALKDYVTTTNLEAKLAQQKTEIKEEVISELSDTFATEDSILNSIQTGKIGETILIPLSEIEKLTL